MTNEFAIRILTGDVLGTSEQTHEAIKMAVKALSRPDVGDTIYRQDAIDVADAIWSVTGDKNVAKVWNQLKDLPSAQSTMGQVNDTAQSTNDCISRQAAIDEANAWLLDCLKVQKQNRSCELIRRLEDLPSAEPEIIYCGECKYMMPNGRCSAFADPSIRPSASDYCSSAERRQYE